MTSTSNNTVYLVTGASSGIGLGLVSSLLLRPHTTVIGTARNTTSCSTLSQTLSAIPHGQNSTFHVFPIDYTTAPDPSTLLPAFSSAFPTITHIDVLICNAGAASSFAPALTTTPSFLRADFEINTLGPLVTLQALYPLLTPPLRNPTLPPKYIYISSSVASIAGMDLEPLPTGSYGPSKCAGNYLVRRLHFEGVENGLVSVAVHPGWVRTGMGRGAARGWGVDEGDVPGSVAESVRGILGVVDGATREGVGGRFVRAGSGEELAW